MVAALVLVSSHYSLAVIQSGNGAIAWIACIGAGDEYEQPKGEIPAIFFFQLTRCVWVTIWIILIYA